jgi:hypothetical protein
MQEEQNTTPAADVNEAIRQEEAERLRIRQELEAKVGQVWDTAELRRDFDIEGFGGGLVVARRRSDNERGSLAFQHSPRFYFRWVPA